MNNNCLPVTVSKPVVYLESGEVHGYIFKNVGTSINFFTLNISRRGYKAGTTAQGMP